MKYSLMFAALVLATNLGLGRAAAQPAPHGPDEKGGFSGKVVETMNAGDYTYVRVDTGKTNLWAAAPKFEVKVGDAVATSAGLPMPDYHSKTLNRDFPVVYFAARVSVNGVSASQAGMSGMQQLPKDHPPIAEELPKGHPPITGWSDSTPKVDLSGIKKARGGQTIAEVYAQKEKLNGKQIKVRGKVVKYNAHILGKNWVHLRDGTGTEGNNDLLVTTSSETKVGDTVLATGTLSLNKDFGANYKYPLMIEDGKIVVE